MKKIDIKSLLIGFLSCVVLVLIVSFKSIEPNIAGAGTYQSWGHAQGGNYMINTITGELYVAGSGRVNIREWKRKSPKTNWMPQEALYKY